VIQPKPQNSSLSGAADQCRQRRYRSRDQAGKNLRTSSRTIWRRPPSQRPGCQPRAARRQHYGLLFRFPRVPDEVATAPAGGCPQLSSVAALWDQAPALTNSRQSRRRPGF
jgi:hypothetical protein